MKYTFDQIWTHDIEHMSSNFCCFKFKHFWNMILIMIHRILLTVANILNTLRPRIIHFLIWNQLHPNNTNFIYAQHSLYKEDGLKYRQIFVASREMLQTCAISWGVIIISVNITILFSCLFLYILEIIRKFKY